MGDFPKFNTNTVVVRVYMHASTLKIISHVHITVYCNECHQDTKMSQYGHFGHNAVIHLPAPNVISAWMIQRVTLAYLLKCNKVIIIFSYSYMQT